MRMKTAILKRYYTIQIISVSMVLALFLSACASNNFTPLKTAEFVDRSKFEGEWYVIANIPYFAEKGKVASRTIYKKRGPNLYDDIFIYRDKSFDNDEKRKVGKVVSMNSNNTQWKSTFYWVLNFKFDVLYVDEDYKMILFGHPSRDYAWVMARSNTLTDTDYQRAMQVFIDNDYDTSRISKVPQTRAQVGQPGFQNTGK